MSDDEDWREDCAPRRILELFSTKWTSMVLHVLHARLGGSAPASVLLVQLVEKGYRVRRGAQSSRQSSSSLTG